jgi:hypothetical protein
MDYGVATADYTYCGADQSPPRPNWRKYPPSEYQRPANQESVPISFLPDLGPFGPLGGHDVSCNCPELAYADQSTQDIFVVGNFNEFAIQEWDENNHRVGPLFGGGHVGGAGRQGIAIDGSNGPNRGSVYVRSNGQQISMFGPPVVVPDISYTTAEVGHTVATLNGTISPAGGTNVQECKVEYGLTKSYGSSAPCDQPTPYSGDTDVSAHLSGLFVETTYHYRIVATNTLASNLGVDQTFHTHAVLDANTEPATNVTMSTADLNGMLDPDGMSTQYHFQYGTTTLYGHETESADAGAGSGDISLPPQTISNLQSGRTYHYRLVAENSLGTTNGPDMTVKAARTPAIDGVYTTNVSATSADLNARINPSGSDTTYHFEYGTTPAYGSVAPAADVDIGSADADQTVTAHLSDLQSGVTYHFRVIATNSWGTTTGDDTTFDYFPPTCPNAHVRQQVGANYLPDCRAYELVSPGDAGGIQLFSGSGVPHLGSALPPDWENTPQNTGYASSPSRFAYFGALGEIPGTHAPDSLVDMYVATRTLNGWATTYPGLPGDQSLFVVGPHCSADLSQCYDFHWGVFFGSEEVNKTSPVAYRFNVDGSFRGRLPTNAGVVPHSAEYKGVQRASGDFRHFVFSSNNYPFAPGGVVGAPGSVYDNDTDTNSVAIVSKLASGDPIPQSGSDPNEYLQIPAVSFDGSHILMSAASATPNTSHLYMSVDDSLFYDVSKGFDVNFVGASRDGSKVFFTSKEPVTSDDHDSSTDLFMWSEAGDKITRISQGDGNGDTNKCVTQWEGINCGVAPVETGVSTDDVVSPNGAIMFYSPEQLDPANPGVPGERNLYLYRDGSVRYIATMDPGSTIARLQMSPDADHSALLTDSTLTGYDNTAPDGVCSEDKEGGKLTGPKCREIYTFDADTGVLQCVSCNPTGEPPSNDIFASASGRFMSDDGRTFFSTADSLAPRDTDGIQDVYEFVEGRPQLISSGTGKQDRWGGGLLIFPPSIVGLEAVSRDGTDVFFSSFDTLVSEDHNGQFLKFYDARTNGGFPEPPPALPCTAADECHGEGSATPEEPQIGSGAALGGGGNVHPARPQGKRHKLRRHRRHRRHSQRSARHG